MSDPCSLTHAVCAVGLVFGLVSIAMSARLLRIVMREAKRIRERTDLERRIIEAEIAGDRSAVLPPARLP
jgi:hypothetical protein